MAEEKEYVGPARSVHYGPSFMQFAGEEDKPEGRPFAQMAAAAKGGEPFAGVTEPESAAQNLRNEGYSEAAIRGALAAFGIPYTAPPGTEPSGADPGQGAPGRTVEQVNMDLETAQADERLRARYPKMNAVLKRTGGTLEGSDEPVMAS